MIQDNGGPMSAAIQAAGARVEIWPLLTSTPNGKEPGYLGLSYPVDVSVLQELIPRLRTTVISKHPFEREFVSVCMIVSTPP